MSARKTAVQILEKCRKTGSWSGPVIDEYLNRSGLEDERDRRLVTALCLGVMQNSSCLDFYIDRFNLTVKGKLDPVVRDILRTGVYQLLYMDRIPDRAVVNETVALCDDFRAGRAKSFVNAVLRKIASSRDSLPEIPGKGTAEYLSIRYSHPMWLCELLMARKGYEFTEAFLKENNTAPSTDLQVNTVKISGEDYAKALEAAGIEFERPENVDDCFILRGGSVTGLPGYEEGEFFIQDLAARLASDAAGVKPGMKVLDCCASPGGKSFSAACRMQGKGEIVSCDISAKKTAAIDTNAARLGLDLIRTEVSDAKVYRPEWKEAFDTVIADVPCSGIGVIRKKPEIRNKTYEEISGLPAIQRQILNNVSRYVKPGGVLLYSTCTVLSEENEETAEAFLQQNGDFVPEDFTVGTVCSQNGQYTFWPNADGTDGFFIARFRRK